LAAILVVTSTVAGSNAVPQLQTPAWLRRKPARALRVRQIWYSGRTPIQNP